MVLLETREIYPLGGLRLTRIDVRFIAATNQDLEHLIAEKRFRRDLYYRLNIARLFVPSLRERQQDIPGLLDFYLRYFNRVRRCEVRSPTPELMKRLVAYAWPGNVRELRNLMETLFIDPPNGPISLDNLPDEFQKLFQPYVTQTLNERELLVSALYETNWNKSEAAARLKWSRMSVYRKMSKYDIRKS